MPIVPRLMNARLFSSNDWQLQKYSVITIGDLRLSIMESYPILAYRQRSFLIHKRCHDLTGQLSPSQLRLLIDLVEPTFLNYLAPLSRYGPHGAFTATAHCSLGPVWSLSRLPQEIQDMIFEHDIGRLMFVMKTASQLLKGHKTVEAVPEHRFTETLLTLNSDMIRVHLVDIGGRTYISHISDTPNLGVPTHARIFLRLVVSALFDWILYTLVQKHISGYIVPVSVITALGFTLFSSTSIALFNAGAKISQNSSRDYMLGESNFLAIRSDEMGVIDIAFQQTHAGPKWVLNTYARPFHAKLSVIQGADTRRLRIIRDTQKCRAIVPLNRAGAEPYFSSKLMPPHGSWVDSGLPVEPRYSMSRASLRYFTRATYIPLATLESIRFQIDPLVGISNIDVNISDSYETLYFTSFRRPPRSVRFSLCERELAQQHLVQIPYLQFGVDGQWRPPIPPHWSPLQKHIHFDDPLGVWWGETFPFIPIQIGIVVSDKARLRTQQFEN
ncbi:hypothetical protein LOZ51_002141 [Ophidiomyces ophidiicola]|nr:hypothetical protein LOZ55_004702 [Ophidiomyces ophidiicola]KAI1998410.1 hypothetical protein LOZ51_002141 [Ophidiomyces ophidiicola]